VPVAPEGEKFAARWKRRAVTIPTVLAATAAAVELSPLLGAAAAAYDVARLRTRFPAVRTLLFLLQYLVNDSVEILVAPAYWVWAGFGSRLGSAASIARHQRLQRWSADVLERRARQLLGVRLALEAGVAEALGPAPAAAPARGAADALGAGPVIVCCRHANLLDSALPMALLHPRGYEVRGVIMAEMLADPGFDLLYGRLGSVFIARDRGPEAQQAVAYLARGATPRTAAVIFPEGRLFRPALLQPLRDRVASRDPGRARRLSTLRNVLPPRPGGLSALLDALPGADVVFVGHAGLEAVPRLADFARVAPLREPVRVTAWRCPRAGIPAALEERTAWLDGQWQRMDDWVSGN
jgi:1-acyl-sn-glycerol-3-phosphate acyltransferase